VKGPDAENVAGFAPLEAQGGERMRKWVALLTLAVSLPGLAFAGDHVASRAAMDARLDAAAAARAADLSTLDQLLATPQAERAAKLAGSDASRLRASLATLSDSEARELAQRAQALQTDPAAGLSGDVNTLLIIFLIVAIVILVIQAVD
jgi:hypothetical protein